MPDDELKLPREGLETIGIAFTREAMKRIIAGIKKLHGEGLPEDKILAKMKEEMRGFSAHTLKRLHDIAAGKPVTEDFAKDDILAQKATGKDAFALQLRKPRPDLAVGSVVRFLGGDWYVKRIAGALLELRKI